MSPICFNVKGVDYLIQDAPGTNYKEIVFKNTGSRVENEKQVCRDYGINVSTDPNIMNTHQAIEELLKTLTLSSTP
jgi:hypothetical protein